MVRYGDLVAVGSEKREHSNRWMRIYEPAPPPEPASPDTPQPWGGIEALADVLQVWFIE